MFDNRLIKNLQNKPESFKRIIMWFGVFLAMAVIFIFWLATFPFQIPETKNNESVSILKKELPGVWQTLKGQLNNLKDLENLWRK